jgi:hypothetical protein
MPASRRHLVAALVVLHIGGTGAWYFTPTPASRADRVRHAGYLTSGIASADSASGLPRPTTNSALDSAVRRIVVAGIVRMLYQGIGRTVTDSVSRPWVLFARDSTNEWKAERAGLAKLLRARARTSEDRYFTALFVSGVEVGSDSVRANLSVVYYQRCDTRWTARGTDYRWIAPRHASWRVEGPVVERLWDGLECAELARDPNVPGAIPPPPDDHSAAARVARP